MNDKRNEVSQVQDRITDRWIKVLSLFAMLTIPLIGTIGYQNDAKQQSIIDGQKATNKVLKEVVETLSVYNVMLENHTGRISRTEADVKEVRGVVIDHTKRIIILEGRK